MAQLRCRVWSISLNDFVNQNFIVNTDNLPIQGLDPDLKVYGDYEPYPEPPFDSRGYKLITTEQRQDQAHPIYNNGLLTFSITHSLQRLTDAELNESVDNMESWANNQISSPTLLGFKRQRAQKALRREAKGQNLTNDELELLNSMDDIADIMEDNYDNAQDMKEYIANNPTLVPDFDSGWTISL